VGPRAGLDELKGEKYRHCPCRKLNPGRQARSLVTTLTELFRIL